MGISFAAESYRLFKIDKIMAYIYDIKIIETDKEDVTIKGKFNSVDNFLLSHSIVLSPKNIRAGGEHNYYGKKVIIKIDKGSKTK